MDAPTAHRSPRRRARAAAPGRTPLDRGRIQEAALRLMDASGLEALSMRRLATELDVEAMSLYYHVPGKAALLEGLAGAVLAEVEIPRADDVDRPVAVRSVARALRSHALRHPNALPLLGALGFGSTAARRHAEEVLDLFVGAGFEPQAAFSAFLLVRSYVLGYVLWETRHAAARAAGTIPPTDAGTLVSADVPHLAPVAALITSFDNDAEFERGLDVLVAGLGLGAAS